MKLHKYIIAILFLAASAGITAQYSNTLYFMDEISERNAMNPAFLPRCQSYFDLFLLPNFYVGGGENLFILRDINNIDKLKNRLINGANIRENFNFHLNLINFGFAIRRDQYFIFESGINVDEITVVPKDITRFFLEGMPDPNQRYSYQLKDLDLELNAFAYAGIGYSGRLSRMTTFGIKAKALIGLANTKMDIYKMELQTSKDNWTLYSQATANVALCMPIEYQINEDGKLNFKTLKLGDIGKTKPAGYGAALDLGVTVEPIQNLVISAAITDLGLIHWYTSSLNEMSLNTNVVFDGFANFNATDSLDNIGSYAEEKMKNLGDKVMDSISMGKGKPYNSMIYAKFNAGIEYGILKNKISFGVMNRLTFNNKRLYDEVTLAVNFRPCQWFKAALSYSFVNGNWGTLGLGLNLNLAAVNMYLIADYLPITWANVTSAEKNIHMSLPDRLNQFNLQAGIAFNLHRFDRDNDRDGVPNRYDECPDQDIEYLQKLFPKKKVKELRDKSGCILDEDKDGVSDFEDQCPNTPIGVTVDSLGCPVDSDNDGVADYLDKCPETPVGVSVDTVGCPVDSDNDGVPDYLDKCPETLANVRVDSVGCPIDTDDDGVPDYMDRCPETPKNIIVDTFGCPIDSDGDGVADYLDKCPEEPGVAENQGCPKEPEKVEPPEEVRNVFKKAMTGIQFETAKATIKKISYPILDQIVAIMEMDTTYRLEISGHTDNQGDHDKNLRLSHERAQSVANYLIKKGISADRLTAVGYGPDRPIEDNSTKKGRAANRRVEFEIVYERVTYKTRD